MLQIARCKACDTNLNAGSAGELCKACVDKKLSCRVCGKEFVYQDILDDLPIVQCPVCEGRAIDVLE